MNAEVFDQMAELKDKIDAVDARVDNLAAKEDRKSATLCRARILRFCDEILHGVAHSKEHYDQILLDITDYSQYCDAHPDFVNHVTKHAKQEIENAYQRLLETNGFL